MPEPRATDTPQLAAARSCSGEMAKNGGDASERDIYTADMDAEECPAGLDPELWRYYNYTCGLRNTALTGMFLVSLLFVPLAAVLLCRLPPEPPYGYAYASAAAPAAAEAAKAAELLQLRHSVAVVWTVSLLLCSYLGFWIYTFSRTMGGAGGVFLRVSYGAALAYAAAGLAGPAAGIGAAHLNTAWTAGLLGYALAEYRIHAGSERAAAVAAARAPAATLSEGQELTLVYCVMMSGLMTLCMAARVVWVVFFDFYGEGYQFLGVMELSFLIWWILYLWVILMTHYQLHDALVSRDSMNNLLWYYMASVVVSPLFTLLSLWFAVYYMGLEMMAMAAFFGYSLAVHAHCKVILARDQPLLKDLELGDVAQESASASTGENARPHIPCGADVSKITMDGSTNSNLVVDHAWLAYVFQSLIYCVLKFYSLIHCPVPLICDVLGARFFVRLIIELPPFCHLIWCRSARISFVSALSLTNWKPLTFLH